MLETPHVMVGAAIATAIPNPWIAIPLAFTSHFILEMVPHWNPHLNSETKKFGHVTRKSTVITAIDATTALVLGSIVAFKFLPDVSQVANVLACSFFAVLPDIIEGPYFFLKIRNKFIEKWISFQKSLQNDTSIIPGIITQLLVIFAAIFWIKH